MSDSVRPHGWQPTRLPRPWDSTGKNTGVGCHFFLQCMKVKSESKVAQSCPTLSDPIDCSLPDSSIHGIFQARVLEWGAIAFSATISSTCHFNIFVSLWAELWPPLPIALTINLPFIFYLPLVTNFFQFLERLEASRSQDHHGWVTQSCLTLWDPMDGSLPGYSVHGILQARILEWVAIPFSRESS